MTNSNWKERDDAERDRWVAEWVEEAGDPHGAAHQKVGWDGARKSRALNEELERLNREVERLTEELRRERERNNNT